MLGSVKIIFNSTRFTNWSLPHIVMTSPFTCFCSSNFCARSGSFHICIGRFSSTHLKTHIYSAPPPHIKDHVNTSCLVGDNNTNRWTDVCCVKTNTYKLVNALISSSKFSIGIARLNSSHKRIGTWWEIVDLNSILVVLMRAVGFCNY